MAAKTAIKEPKRSSALVRRETFASYCFLLPSLIFFLGFVIYPMILCVVTSFFDSTMNRADIFVGMANYKTLFADPIFLGALKNTFVIVIVSVPVTCIFSLWVSSAIVDLPEWTTSLFRCVFYLPVVTGSVAVTVVWKWMYNNYYGIFNYLGDYYQITPGWTTARTEWWNMLQRVGSGEAVETAVKTFVDHANAAAAAEA